MGDGSYKVEVDPKEIKSRCVLLQRYLDHKGDLELQALFALQALIHSYEHPSGKNAPHVHDS